MPALGMNVAMGLGEVDATPVLPTGPRDLALLLAATVAQQSLTPELLVLALLAPVGVWAQPVGTTPVRRSWN